jgi:hypothetical protein
MTRPEHTYNAAYLARREKALAYMREYTKKNKAKILNRSKEWANSNPERVVAATLRWRNNLELGYSEYMQRVSTRLGNSISNLMWHDLRKFGIVRGKQKGGRRCDLVSWTLPDLMQHLESQFVSGMSWNTYGRGEGKWCIDHIRPRSLFTFTSTTCKAFKECWALSNLRPLWYIDNLRKSGRGGDR